MRVRFRIMYLRLKHRVRETTTWDLQFFSAGLTCAAPRHSSVGARTFRDFGALRGEAWCGSFASQSWWREYESEECVARGAVVTGDSDIHGGVEWWIGGWLGRWVDGKTSQTWWSTYVQQPWHWAVSGVNRRSITLVVRFAWVCRTVGWSLRWLCSNHVWWIWSKHRATSQLFILAYTIPQPFELYIRRRHQNSVLSSVIKILLSSTPYSRHIVRTFVASRWRKYTSSHTWVPA